MKAIVAMDPCGIIGYNGQIPWKISDDLKWFKEFTMGKTLIAGRTTFDALPPLMGRDIIVLTHLCCDGEYYLKNKHKCNHLYVRSPDLSCVVDRSGNSVWKDAVVIGGAKTYSLLLPFCSEIYVSHVIDEYNGDTYMPPFEHMFPNSALVRDYKDFWVVRYWK